MRDWGKTLQAESSQRCWLCKREELYVSMTASGLDSKGLKGLQRMTVFLHDCISCLSLSVIAFCTTLYVWLIACSVTINLCEHEQRLINMLKMLTMNDTENKRTHRHTDSHTHLSQMCHPVNASYGCVQGITSALSVNLRSRAYLLLMNTASR